MGSSTSSCMIAVPSRDPRIDREILRCLFPDKTFTVEKLISDGDTSLVDIESGIYIILKHCSSDFPGISLTWLVSNDVIECLVTGSRIEAHNDTLPAPMTSNYVEPKETPNGSYIAVVSLPGGSRIIAVPPTVAQSEEGRLFVCSCLDFRNETSLAERMTEKVDHEFVNVSLDDEGMNGGAMQTRESRDEVDTKLALPSFPSLQVSLLQNENLGPNFPINSRTPVDFETDIFKGKILMLLRPKNLQDDPYWSSLFSRKKRSFILQVQGKFKRKPTGQIFVGAEITERMKMGLFTRGILGILIKCLSQFFSDFSHSFGNKEETEFPRIAAPAHRAFERLVVTPPGKDPPVIGGDPFQESDSERSERIKSSNWEWDTESTYSFSFYSMYVDLPTWRVVNLKVSGNIDLSTLWGDSALRIVLYEHMGGKHHFKKENKYAMVLQIKHSEEDEDASSQEADEDLIQTAESTEMYLKEHSESELDFRQLARTGSDFPALVPMDAFDEEFFDAEEHSNVTDMSDTPFVPSLAMDMLLNIDITVPAWVDLVCPKKGDYQRTYALSLNNALLFYKVSSCEKALKESGIASDTNRLISETFSPRLSSEEKYRRLLAISILKNSKKVLKVLNKESHRTGDVLLLRETPELSEKYKSRIREASFLLRAISDRHFMEEFAIITNQSISFHYPGKKQANLRISLYNINRLSSPTSSPLKGFSHLCIETAGRTVHLLFRDSNDCLRWLDTLEPLAMKKLEIEESGVSESSGSYSLLEDTNNPAAEYMIKSTMWNCKNRRLLNCGFFLFTASKESDPLSLVERTLILAMDPWLSTDIKKRRLFLNSAASLKNVDYSKLSEEGLVVFFLNLYHIMIAHAFLVLGPPGSSLKWISFFNQSAYQVGDDIFSLSELEHNIIRANMSPPSQFLSRFVIPKSQYRIGLKSSDFRYNFALNCGSTSNPKQILIYKLGHLHEQLDQVTRLALRNASVVTKPNGKEVVVTLPRICQWYSNDFGASSEQMLRKVCPYLEDSSRLSPFWIEAKQRYNMNGISVKFDDYSFQCQNLELLNSPPS